MKKQLRNLALASALLTAGAAFAGAPVLEEQWSANVTAAARYATIYDGKAYFVDNSKTGEVVGEDGSTTEVYTTVVYSLDKDGNKTEILQKENVQAVSLGIDQAGNILLKNGTIFHASTTSYQYIIFARQEDGSYVEQPLVSFDEASTADPITKGDVIPAFRSEVFGQIIGDVMSEEGAIMYVAGYADNPYTYTLFFQNGAKGDYSVLDPQDGLYNAKSSVSTDGDNITFAQPIYSNMTEVYEAIDNGEKIQDSFVQRKRGNGGKVQYINADGEFDVLVTSDSFSTAGLAYFKLDKVAYVVVPDNNNSGLGHPNNFQVVRVSDGAVVGRTSFTHVTAGSGQCGYSVEVVDEKTVNILSAVPGVNINVATVTLKPVVYFDNTEAGWEHVYAYCWNAESNNTWPGVEITEIAEDGTYQFVGFDEAYENIIFNNGGNGEQTADFQLIQDQVYGLYYPHIYLIGNLPDAIWNPGFTSAELSYVGNGVYEIDNVTFAESSEGSNTAYFSFITAAGSWPTVEAYDRIGAENADEAIESQANVSIQKVTANSWKLDAYEVEDGVQFNYIYKLTLDVVNKTLTVGKTSGVKAINVDANAPAVYYNLQGVQVENPQNGLFIVKRGNKVSKEVIL
ncbi:MAG: starch-binding protein [Muribaculaceae bacterium]